MLTESTRQPHHAKPKSNPRSAARCFDQLRQRADSQRCLKEYLSLQIPLQFGRLSRSELKLGYRSLVVTAANKRTSCRDDDLKVSR